MDLVKQMFHEMFKQPNQPIQIEYWDGQQVTYGVGVPKVSVRFAERLHELDLWLHPDITLGEAYMDEKVVLIRGDLADLLAAMPPLAEPIWLSSMHHMNQTMRRSFMPLMQMNKQYVQHHYDIGNSFFRLWLDETMSYSCAYFQTEEDSLDTAQQQKINHILKKLQLQRGESLLDIGCGWGSLIVTAAQVYGVKATGITLSEEQYEFVIERIRQLHLEGQVTVQLKDYIELAKENKKFDKIVTVGMAEHVGQSNLTGYYKAISDLLLPGGLALVHHITQKKERDNNPWIEKYIFPGGYIPSLREAIHHLSEYDLEVLDVENLREHYAKTLRAWRGRFEEKESDVREMFDDRFIRMWRLYLVSSAASFDRGDNALHQILVGKNRHNQPLTRAYMYTT